MSEGRVEQLWRKRVRLGPMDPVPRARLVTGEGIEEDANRGRSRRQVTLIADELVAAVKVLDHCAGRVPSRRQRKVSPLTTRFSVAP